MILSPQANVKRRAQLGLLYVSPLPPGTEPSVNHRAPIRDFFVATLCASTIFFLVILGSAPGTNESSIHLNTEEYVLFFTGSLVVASLTLPLINYAIYMLCGYRKVLHAFISVALVAIAAVVFQPSIVQYAFRPSENTIVYWLLLLDILAIASLAGIDRLRSDGVL
jgi:hypothetical protein